jgi:hypothetical protein
MTRVASWVREAAVAAWRLAEGERWRKLEHCPLKLNLMTSP